MIKILKNTGLARKRVFDLALNFLLTHTIPGFIYIYIYMVVRKTWKFREQNFGQGKPEKDWEVLIMCQTKFPDRSVCICKFQNFCRYGTKKSKKFQYWGKTIRVKHETGKNCSHTYLIITIN